MGTRFRTLEVAAVIELDSAALEKALSRTLFTREARGTDSIPIVQGGDGDANWLRYEWRVWWASPTLWRDDIVYANGATITTIVRPDAALTYISMQQTRYTSERVGAHELRAPASPFDSMQLPTVAGRLQEFPLIRPRLPASDWQLAAGGETLYLGRPARIVRATRRTNSVRSDDGSLSGYWPGIEEYECVVDDELQIVLSVVGTMTGASVAKISVEHLNVDAPVASGIFRFSAPARTRVVKVPNK
jgi:hypothetical protein